MQVVRRCPATDSGTYNVNLKIDSHFFFYIGLPTKLIASFDAADYVCSVTVVISYVVQVNWPAAKCSSNMGLKEKPHPNQNIREKSKLKISYIYLQFELHLGLFLRPPLLLHNH